MRPRTTSGATKGLGSELFSVLLRHDDSDEIVGMGRVVGDGGTVFHICDMAVDQNWQGNGGGTMIMDSLMGYITREASNKSYINLMADVDGFYEKWGFKPTIPNSRGMFLRLSDQPTSEQGHHNAGFGDNSHVPTRDPLDPNVTKRSG